MSLEKIDALLQQLREVGTLDVPGSFTLSKLELTFCAKKVFTIHSSGDEAKDSKTAQHALETFLKRNSMDQIPLEDVPEMLRNPDIKGE